MTHHTSEQLFDGVKTNTFVGSGTGHRWGLWVQGAELLRFCPEQFQLAGLLAPWEQSLASLKAEVVLMRQHHPCLPA